LSIHTVDPGVDPSLHQFPVKTAITVRAGHQSAAAATIMPLNRSLDRDVPCGGCSVGLVGVVQLIA